MTYSRHPECNEGFRTSCFAFVVNSKLGFTLPEVCVAFLILFMGTTALLGCWDFFNREVADERSRLELFYDVESAIELLIVKHPMCADSLVILDSVNVRFIRILGNNRLVWATAERDGFSLKRLIRCR